MKTLLPLLQLAEAERDRALAVWQATRDASRDAQSQFDQLLGYRREYEQRWQGQFSQQGQIELVHCYQGFILRLNQAIEHQQAAVQLACTHLEAAGEQLRAREIRVVSVRKLIERRDSRALLAEQRHEQKNSDEYAARRSLENVSPGDLASSY